LVEGRRREGWFLTRTAGFASCRTPGLTNPTKRSGESDFDSAGPFYSPPALAMGAGTPSRVLEP
jgi:hypothetical protein